jgi:hypothetical protein
MVFAINTFCSRKNVEEKGEDMFQGTTTLLISKDNSE